MDNEENQQLPVSVAEPAIAKEQDNPDHSSSSSQSSYSQQSNASVSHSSINSKDKEDQSRTIRYKYCCKTCKHPDKSKKACVCVVPLSQRRTDLGGGCRNCGCKGCSKEDFLKKGQDPEYKPSETRQFLPQKVSEFYRKEQKPMDNNPRRFGNNTNIMTGAPIRERSRSNRRIKSPRRRRSSSSRSKSREMIDTLSMKFYNIDRSLLGNMIINEFQINPCLLGFGVPQRSQSYIMGRPK